MANIDPEKFYKELQDLGEPEVRNRLASERIYGSDKRPFVTEWLDRKDRERIDALNREQMEIDRAAADAARDSADAARDAADEAKQANMIARVAIVIAIISAMISVIALA